MQKSLGALLAGQADVTQVAAEWEKDALAERLTWLDLWLSSLARAALAGNADLITFPGRLCALAKPAAHVEHKRRLQHGGSRAGLESATWPAPRSSASWPSNPG